MEKGVTTEATQQVLHNVYQRLTKEGYSIARDADLARPQVRALIRSVNPNHEVKEFWVHVTAPERVILERLRHREPTRVHPNVKVVTELYRARKAMYESIPDLKDLRYFYTFDTSRDDLDQQVDEFVQKAQQVLA